MGKRLDQMTPLERADIRYLLFTQKEERKLKREDWKVIFNWLAISIIALCAYYVIYTFFYNSESVIYHF